MRRLLLSCVGSLAVLIGLIGAVEAEAPPAAAEVLPDHVVELRRLLAAGRTEAAVALARDRHRRLAAERGATDRSALTAALELARLHRFIGQSDAAEAVLKDLLTDEQRVGTPASAGYQGVVVEYADLLKARGRTDEAMALYAEAIGALRLSGIAAPAEAQYLLQLGQLQRHKGAFKEAEAALREAVSLMEKERGSEHTSLYGPVNMLAGVTRVLAKHEESERLYRRAIALATRELGPRHANVGIMHDNLGVLYQQTKRYAEAEEAQKTALDILEQSLGREHPTTAQTIANLAANYYAQRRTAEALRLNLRAIAVFETTLQPGDARLGVLYDNTAGAYRELGQRAEALGMYERALATLRKTYPDDHPEIGTVLNNLSVAMRSLQRNAEARELGLRALAITEKAYGPSSEKAAVNLTNIADTELALGNPSAARVRLERAIAMLEAAHDPEHRSLVHPLVLLGEVAVAQGSPALALSAYRRAAAIEIKARARERSLRRGDGRDRSSGNSVFEGLIDAAWQASATAPPAEAEALADEAFAAGQWMTLSSAGAAVAQLGARLGASSPELARLVRERQDLAAEWSAADARLTEAAARPASGRVPATEETLRARMVVVDTRIRDVDQQLARSFPAFAALASPQALSAGEVRQLLGPTEALLAYVVDGRSVHAFLLKRGSIQWHRVQLSSREVARKVQALRCGLDPAEWIGDVRPARCLQLLGRGPEQDELPFDTAAAADLYEALLKPFAASLEGVQLLVSPSGPLTGLPFQALLSERPAPGTPLGQMRWVARQTAVTVLPSVSSLNTLRRQVRPSQATRPFLGIGNPLLLGAAGDMSQAWGAQSCLAAKVKQRAPGLATVAKAPPPAATFFRGGRVDVAEVRRLEPLPETRDELCAVAQSLGAGDGDLALGSRASEAHVRKLEASGALQSYRIVHFATHGLIAGEVEGLAEPALVLTPPDQASEEDDGLLTASEVAALRLDADWVILSACNTAAGEEPGAEQLSGLARAFFYAGARSLLVSHWPVQSVAAVKLTTRTLSELQRDRTLTRGEALRRAMAALLSDSADPRNAHPQVWAPFIVVGEGSAAASAALPAAVRNPAPTAIAPVVTPPAAAPVATPGTAPPPPPTAAATPIPPPARADKASPRPKGEVLPWLKSQAKDGKAAAPAAPNVTPEAPGPFSPVQ